MGREEGNLAYWFLKLCFLFLISGPAFSELPAGVMLSCRFPASSFPPLLFLVFLAFPLSWGPVETAGVPVVPSRGGRVSGGRSVSLGFPSACCSLGILGLEAERWALVRVELQVKKQQQEKTNSHLINPAIYLTSN